MERISLGNTVFEGRNNVYVLDGETTTLVDTGVATDAVRADLRAGLDALGLAVTDIDEVLLTHWHHDHAGLAGEIQAESGATVRVHEADAPLVANDPDAIAHEEALRRRRFREWGIPDEKRAELEAFLDHHSDLRGEPTDVTPLTDGDVVSAGDTTLEAIHLPGHAAGLTAFAFEGDAGTEAFVGDVVLPKYTPNVGGADLRVEGALDAYVDSLTRVVECDFARAWPGHRDPIDGPTARARTILDHHRERTRRVVSVLDEHGPADPWTVSAHLFGELANIHILHGPGEAFAHLDHLRTHGVVGRDGDAYVLSDPTADVEALFPDTKH